MHQPTRHVSLRQTGLQLKLMRLLVPANGKGWARADRDALRRGAQKLPHVAGLVGLVQVVDAWQVKAPGELPAQEAALR